jgi:hypothetical protein
VIGAPAVAFRMIAPPNAISGTPFDITVVAVDPFGNTDTNYQGTVTFCTSDTDPAVVLPPTTPSSRAMAVRRPSQTV